MSAEVVRVTIDGLTLVAPARHQPSTGASNVLAVLRPESLLLSPDDNTPSWRGEVVGRRFAGGHTVYRVRLANDIEVEVIGDGGGAHEGGRTGVRLAGVPVAVVPTST